MRTARTVTTSDSSVPSRAARSSYRQASTTVLSRPSCRAASRRNAAFLVLDSTMRSRTAGAASFIGIAGDPPPDPTSVMDTPGRGSRCAATSGSTTSLSRPRSSSASAVRLMRRFQRIRRPTYAARLCGSGSATCRPARLALAAMRIASRGSLMSGIMECGGNGRGEVRVAGPASPAVPACGAAPSATRLAKCGRSRFVRPSFVSPRRVPRGTTARVAVTASPAVPACGAAPSATRLAKCGRSRFVRPSFVSPRRVPRGTTARVAVTVQARLGGGASDS